MGLDMRGLELHGRHIWSREAIARALDVVVRNALDTLVLHETDLVQMVTYPRSYLDPYGLWRTRRPGAVRMRSRTTGSGSTMCAAWPPGAACAFWWR